MALIATYLGGADVSELVRDPTSIAEVAPWTGFLSTLAVMAWAAAAGACVTAGLALRGAGDPNARFMLATAALIGYIALDDGLLLHEGIGPDYVGIPELAMYGLLLGAVAGWLFGFRDEIASTDAGLLIMGMGCLGVSLASDVVGVVPGPAEDGLKLAGIAGMVAWAFVTSREALLPGIVGQQPADERA